MGCSVSSASRAPQRSVVTHGQVSSSSIKSRAIDEELLREAAESVWVVKMLLLGPSNSGKSTLAKQMRILNTEGFTHSETMAYKFTLLSNLIDAFCCIARGIVRLQIQVRYAERALVRTFASAQHGQMPSLYDTADLIELAQNFLCFNSVTNACLRINEFHAPDNAEYLLLHSQRILQTNYVPTSEDIVRARQTTNGIHETVFSHKQFTIRLIDVGGQRTERRKWIHAFEGVAAVLFVVSLSCYNQTAAEDTQMNQLKDSVQLFAALVRNKVFVSVVEKSVFLEFLSTSSFILFLNKMDMFERKLPHHPLQLFFPAFEETVSSASFSAVQTFQAAIGFIREMFLSQKDQRLVHTHVTNATDTQSIKSVFGATCDIVIANSVKNADTS